MEGEAGNSTCDWNNPYSILKEFNLPYMYIDPRDSLDRLKNVLFKVMASKYRLRAVPIFPLEFVEPCKRHCECRHVETANSRGKM